MKLGPMTGLLLLAAAAAALPARAADPPRFAAELEAGAVGQSRNDVQIPNDEEGTRFSLVDVVGKGPWPSARAYFTWNINPRHGLRLLYAPLSITEEGSLPAPVRFAGAEFGAGSAVEATYRFDSYRATYHYRFHQGARWTWRGGFTAKIRDAEVRLAQGDTIAKKTDVGFVPLLHVHGEFRFAPRWTMVLDLDALAGGPGRAEDAAVKLRFAGARGWSVSAGYRTVEGGADVDAVYNFAWLHYGMLSARYEF